MYIFNGGRITDKFLKEFNVKSVVRRKRCCWHNITKCLENILPVNCNLRTETGAQSIKKLAINGLKLINRYNIQR